MSKTVKLIAAAITIFALSDIAMASGFALYEYSARGNAMGGAVMANKAEPASIASNPALITQLSATQIQTGATVVAVSGAASVNGDKRDLESTAFVLPNLYITQQISHDVFLGLGFFSRYGLGGEYKDNDTWVQAALAGQAYKMDLLTFSFNPNLAVKLCDDLSFAMGLEIMYLEFKEKKGIGANHFDLKGDSVSWGGNFGLHYVPSFLDKKVGAALTYRTKMRHVASGRIKATGTMAPYDGSASAALTLPDELAFGLSFMPNDKLTLETNIMGVFWSSYSNLRVDYDLPHTPPIANEKKNYNDTFRFGIGAEYVLNDNWDLRLGYVYDKSPINDKYMDTLVPADDRNIFSAGVGYKTGNMGIDFSYNWLIAKDLTGKSESGADIKYTDGGSHMFGLTFKYAFENWLSPFLNN